MNLAYARRSHVVLGLCVFFFVFVPYWYWPAGRSLNKTFRFFNTSTTAIPESASTPSDQEQVEILPPIDAEKLAPQWPGTPDKVVVMAVLESENANWAEEQLPDWRHVIYHVEDPDAYNRVPKNKGKEAMAYLTFIIDFYERLPSIVAFVHSHLDGYPTAWHTDRPGYNNVKSLKELRLDYVRKEGYANLRCNWVPGCPDEVQPFRHPPEKEQEAHMEEVWKIFFGNETEIPKTMAAACCSQFAASREQIRKRSKEDFERYRQWLLGTDLDDDTSGRIFEFLWHIIMGRDPVHCPELYQCYQDTYGS